MTHFPSTDAVGFLRVLAAERCRLAAFRDSVRKTVAQGQDHLGHLERRLQAMEALVESYQAELPGDVSPHPEDDADAAPEVIMIGPLQIHLGRRCAFDADGTEIALTNTQFRLLEILALAAGSDVSRDEISKKLFGYSWSGGRNIDQLVFQVKAKLPRCGDGGELIKSVRGSGYWMRASYSQEAPCPARCEQTPPAPVPDSVPEAMPVLPDAVAEKGVEQQVREVTAARVEAALQPEKDNEAPPPPIPFAHPRKAPRNAGWGFGSRTARPAAVPPAKVGDVDAAVEDFIRKKGMTVCPAAFAVETQAAVSETDRKAVADHARRQDNARVAALPVRKADRKPA